MNSTDVQHVQQELNEFNFKGGKDDWDVKRNDEGEVIQFMDLYPRTAQLSSTHGFSDARTAVHYTDKEGNNHSYFFAPFFAPFFPITNVYGDPERVINAKELCRHQALFLERSSLLVAAYRLSFWDWWKNVVWFQQCCELRTMLKENVSDKDMQQHLYEVRLLTNKFPVTASTACYTCC